MRLLATILLITSFLIFCISIPNKDVAFYNQISYSYIIGDFIDCKRQSAVYDSNTSNEYWNTGIEWTKELCFGTESTINDNYLIELIRLKYYLWLALQLYKRDIGRYPTEVEGMQALCINPGFSMWRGPYLNSCLTVLKKTNFSLKLSQLPEDEIFVY